jgi:branched-chain amino acid transport system substrate-binding protein
MPRAVANRVLVVPRRPALVLGGIVAILATFVLAACGDNDNSDKVKNIQGVSANCGDIEYSGSGEAEKLIVSDLPLQGDSAERSKQMNDAIIQELARKGWQAGAGIQVAFQACDDSIASTGEWDEATCQKNARAYASNSDVVGVIGTYNSGCAAIEMPILNRAPGGGVPMISPGNTFVCLTEPSPTLCQKDEPGVYFPTGKRNYARVVPNDAVQGAGLAEFAHEQGVQKPFVLIASDDPTSEGQGQTFLGAAWFIGMTIAGVEHFDPEADSYAPLMQKVKSSGADAVVLAAILEQNGAQLIKDKVAALGPNSGSVKLFAFDGFAQQATIDGAGSASAGMYTSLPGKAPGSLTGVGSAFVKQVKAQIGDKPLEFFAPYAGQAAQVMIEALTKGKTRSGTIDQIFKYQTNEGIIGSFAITPTGDTAPAPISVQRAGNTFALAGTLVPTPQLVTAARGG